MSEDFTTWTLENSGGKIKSVTADEVIFQTYYRTYRDRIYKDFGTNYFKGNFPPHRLQIYSDWDHGDYGPPGWISLWMLHEALVPNTYVRLTEISGNGLSAIGVGINKGWNTNTKRIYLFEVYGGSIYISTEYKGLTAPGTYFFAEMKRQALEFTMTWYTDDTYTTPIDSISHTLQANPQYDGVQIGGGYDYTGSATWIQTDGQNDGVQLLDVPENPGMGPGLNTAGILPML